MSDISVVAPGGVSVPKTFDTDLQKSVSAEEGALRTMTGKVIEPSVAASDKEIDRNAVLKATEDMQRIVNDVSDNSLLFSVDGELDRLVITVTEVGSENIVRQFPPEEFLTVAKYIAAQEQDVIDEDFLKGILFDVRT